MPPKLTRRNFIRGLMASALTTSINMPMVALQAQSAANRVRCPILMYHYISSPPEDADKILHDLTVPPDLFASHLDYLLSDGFTTITMADLWRGLMGEITLPERPIVITFDDGYWDAFAHATPLLLERGMKGTFYIVPEFIGQAAYLTWEQVNQMHSQGMEIGNHSLTHPDLSRLPDEEQQHEIEQATARIEQAIGSRPTTFCYPFGRQNKITRLTLKQHGYTTAVTTTDALHVEQNNLYRIGRVRIRHTTTPYSLDWLVNREA